MTVLSRALGATLIFTGAFWFVASLMITTIIVVHDIALAHRMMAVFKQRLETDTLSSGDFQLSIASAILGSVVYFLGRLLMRGRLGFWGRALTTTGLLWWLLTGLCYATFFGSETFGAVFGYAFLIMAVGAVFVAVGQTLRRTTAETQP